MSSLSEIRISLSPAAIAEVERLRRKQQCPEAALRVRVQSGVVLNSTMTSVLRLSGQR